MEGQEKYSYSIDGELFKSAAEIMNDIRDNNSIEKIVKGKNVFYDHSCFLHVDMLLENMRCNAEDVTGENMADDYCDELEQKEHEDNLTKIILEYLNANVEQPTFFGIGDVSIISVEEFKKEASEGDKDTL